MIVITKVTICHKYCYGLEFQIKNKNLHLLIFILPAGDITTNPDPFNNSITLFETLYCLSFKFEV